MSASSEITVIPLLSVAETSLPNGSWSRMALTRDSVDGIASSLGYSVFTPGTTMSMVSHDVEEIAFVASGSGELRTDEGVVPFNEHDFVHIPSKIWHAVVNTGAVDLVMVFGFPY